ncbi:ribosomal protein L12E/L44/L45/RPP1/RPP2 [Oikeobacillus pervagus]|uniref:Ribosomal protein L12E/L44/L45/RPP1/RPP2 n=1 Tax=Oikeobacillus pervagus TaxID=1325931 RepID=A0AAJ1WK89_9BACI|nr:hypothetical protein [Oikeobacillus pervagus]MDQ0214876.1 ribosomal protein L12E/L44/L45/RPP1/RPP2 [Oikeobacillus pervagus]
MKIENLINDLQNIYKKIERLEQQLNEVKRQQTIHLSINTVNIESLNLEELAYHLDKIDIKDLSGMLNFGNTFSPALEKKKQEKAVEKGGKKKENETDKKRKDHNGDISIQFNGRNILYHVERTMNKGSE